MENKSRRTTVYFSPAVHQQLRLRAAESGRSISDLVNEIVLDNLEAGPESKQYTTSSSPTGYVHEPSVVMLDITERVEQLERTVGITDEHPESVSPPDNLLTLSSVRERISLHEKRLKELGVRSLSVFGSLAKQRFRSDSDIDLLVEFDYPVGLFRLIDLEQFLTLVLGSEIDLVTPDSLRPKLKNKILDEAIHVFPI